MLPVNRISGSGFTLVELLVSLSLIVLLATISLPGMNGFFDRAHLVSATEKIYSHLQLARMESIARSIPLHVSISANGAIWRYGLSHTNGCDPDQVDRTHASACVLVIDDGDGIVHGEDGAIDTGDLVLMRFTYEAHPDIAATVAGGNQQLTFDPVRGTATPGEIDLASSEGNRLRLRVGLLGKIQICTPDGSMPDYKGC